MSIVKVSDRFFAVCFAAIVLLFTGCAISLIAFSGVALWNAIQPGETLLLSKRFNAILDCIAMLTIAMAALELAKTVIEDEIEQESRLSASARARRVLSRFLVVVIVSLAIESLVAIFKLVHDDPSMISEAAFIAFAAAALLTAWGLFNWLGTRGRTSDD